MTAPPAGLLSFLWRGLVARAATGFIACVLCALVCGCGDDIVGRDSGLDGATEDGGSDGSPLDGAPLLGEIVLVVELNDEGEAPSAALLPLSEVRIRNDRGGDLEPNRTDVGTLDLLSDPEILFTPAIPAVYGQVSFTIGAPGLELRLPVSGGDVIVVAGQQVAITVRCDALPAMLAPGGRIRLDLELEVDSVLEGTEIPDEPGRIDGPEDIARIEAALLTAWQLDCSP